MNAPWLLRTLWHPDRELDLIDDRGRPDHGKSLTTIVILWVLVLVTIGRTPPVGLVMALLAAAFGARVFIALIRSRTITSAETVTLAGRFGGKADGGDVDVLVPKT